MHGNPEEADRSLVVGEEHHALRARMEQLVQAIGRPDDGARWHGMLDAFRSELEQHFWHEEQGGYFRDLVHAAPWLGAKVDQLEREHRDMLAAVDALRTVDLNHATRADVARRFDDLRKFVLDHETRENRLVQDGLCDDLGAAD